MVLDAPVSGNPGPGEVGLAAADFSRSILGTGGSDISMKQPAHLCRACRAWSTGDPRSAFLISISATNLTISSLHRNARRETRTCAVLGEERYRYLGNAACAYAPTSSECNILRSVPWKPIQVASVGASVELHQSGLAGYPRIVGHSTMWYTLFFYFTGFLRVLTLRDRLTT
jgi:hypothetical protein